MNKLGGDETRALKEVKSSSPSRNLAEFGIAILCDLGSAMVQDYRERLHDTAASVPLIVSRDQRTEEHCQACAQHRLYRLCIWHSTVLQLSTSERTWQDTEVAD